VPPRPGALAAADFDGDSRIDVVVWSAGQPDRVTYARNRGSEHPWTCFGHGLAGIKGAPRLVSTGALTAGSPGTLRLENAHPNKLAVLFVSHQSQPIAFYGATLLPFPVLVAAPLTTDAQGVIELAWPFWPLLVPGSTHWFQYGVVDPAGPFGAAFSNALRATQP